MKIAKDLDAIGKSDIEDLVSNNVTVEQGAIFDIPTRRGSYYPRVGQHAKKLPKT